MDNRIQRLRERLFVDGYPLAIEKIRLLTESFRETDGQPQVLRRAKAFAHVLDHITIFIEDDELIVGNAASKPMAVEFECDYGVWPQDEIQALRSEGYTLSQADEDELIRLNEYWNGKTLVARAGQVYDDERLWPFAQSGIVLPPWKTREQGSGGGYAQSGMGLGPGFYLVGFDYPRVLRTGLKQMIVEAEAELERVRFTGADAVSKTYFLKSVIISLNAVIRFAGRFAELAAQMAQRESDPRRKAELERIAANCRHVPANPARTFYEAIQSFWFMFLVTNPQTTARTVTAGYARLMTYASCLVISVASFDDEALGKQLAEEYTEAAWHNHTPADITSFFAGLELVGPGVTEAQAWRAWMPEPVLRHREGHVLAGVARRQA